MKRTIYLFLCILTCAAFITACGKKNTETDDISAEQEISDFESDVDDDELDISEDDIINPSADEEPGDEDLDPENYDNDSSSDDVPVSDASDDFNDDVSTDANDSTTDAQNNVSKNPSKEFTGSGTFNGFVDSSSIEVTMADGTFQTFFVYDEDVLAQLEKLDEAGDSPTIKFTYRGKDGQINPEIVAIH